MLCRGQDGWRWDWRGHRGARGSAVLRVRVVQGLPGGTSAPLARSRRSGQGQGRCTGAEERCGELGCEVGRRSRGLGRDPAAVDGDGDEKGKGLGARRQQWGLSSVRGAAPRLPPRPAVTSVSAPLKICHRVSPQDLAIALQTFRFVWFSCSKFILFFSFLEGEKKAGSALEKWNPT